MSVLARLGSIAASGGGDTSAMESIATYVVASTQGAVTFSNIPNTFKHLQVRCFTRGNRATYPVDGFDMRFNGDSTSGNYRWHQLQGNGADATGGDSGTSSSIDLGQPGTNASSGAFAATIVDILDYASTSKNKVSRSINGLDVNGNVNGYPGLVAMKSGLWLSTAAITSITLSPAIGPSWNQYSHFALYGIKG